MYFCWKMRFFRKFHFSSLDFCRKVGLCRLQQTAGYALDVICTSPYLLIGRCPGQQGEHRSYISDIFSKEKSKHVLGAAPVNILGPPGEYSWSLSFCTPITPLGKDLRTEDLLRFCHPLQTGLHNLNIDTVQCTGGGKVTPGPHLQRLQGFHFNTPHTHFPERCNIKLQKLANTLYLKVISSWHDLLPRPWNVILRQSGRSNFQKYTPRRQPRWRLG